jgi:hypothetical protein
MFAAFLFSFIKDGFQHCCLNLLLVMGNLLLVAVSRLCYNTHTKTHYLPRTALATFSCSGLANWSKAAASFQTR